MSKRQKGGQCDTLPSIHVPLVTPAVHSTSRHAHPRAHVPRPPPTRQHDHGSVVAHHVREAPQAATVRVRSLDLDLVLDLRGWQLRRRLCRGGVRNGGNRGCSRGLQCGRACYCRSCRSCYCCCRCSGAHGRQQPVQVCREHGRGDCYTSSRISYSAITVSGVGTYSCRTQRTWMMTMTNGGTSHHPPRRQPAARLDPAAGRQGAAEGPPLHFHFCCVLLEPAGGPFGLLKLWPCRWTSGGDNRQQGRGRCSPGQRSHCHSKYNQLHICPHLPLLVGCRGLRLSARAFGIGIQSPFAFNLSLAARNINLF